MKLQYTHRPAVEGEQMTVENPSKPARFQEYYDIAVEALALMDMQKVFQVIQQAETDNDYEIDFLSAYITFTPSDRVHFIAHHYARFKVGLGTIPMGELPDIREAIATYDG